MKLCKLIGHKPNGTITGFRNIDAATIMRCRYCNIPIVSPSLKASGRIMIDLYGQSAVDAAIEWADKNEPEPPDKWSAYNQDVFN